MELRGCSVAFTLDIRGDRKTSFDIFGEITTLSLEVRGDDLIIGFEIRGDRTAFSVNALGVSAAFSNDTCGDAFSFPKDAPDMGAVFSVETAATSLEV